MQVDRADARARLTTALRRAPIVLLVGPRQAGKSTLARLVVGPTPSLVFDLEDPAAAAALNEPMLTLRGQPGTVVIDEAQRRPDLFPMLRVLADEQNRPGQFLVLGSASPELVGLAAESLAGRVEIVELSGFRYADIADSISIDTLWTRGGFPRSVLAVSEDASNGWRDNFIATFLERDLANLGIRVPAVTMRRFWTMLAHFHGQTWNGAELARALGVSQPTVRRYLDALTDAMVVRQLQPWFANISKRQVRAPKVYVRDSGLLHRLLGIGDAVGLMSHPKVGASWEGFAIEQLVARGARDTWFWGTAAGAEIDLICTVDARRVGVEIKRSVSPAMTPSIRHALVDLELDRVVVAHAGDRRFALADRVEAVPLLVLLRDGV